MSSVAAKSKPLSARDLFLGIILFMLFLDSGTASSAMGLSSITWYLILGVIFFLPSALTTAELGSTYPSEGGLYHWVKISLGANNACRVAWYYWLNNAIWVASATIFVMDVVSKMITLLSGFEIPFFWYLAASCVLVWVYVFLAAQPQNESTFVRNLGGIAKLTIVGCLVLCAGAFLVKNGGQMATEFNPSEFKPTMGAAFAFFPALIYNVMGFDAISAIGGSNIKDPGRDLPRMILTNLVLIIAIYIIFTLAICTITPMESIDIINGILNCFTLTFSGNLGITLYVIVGIIFLYTLISQGPAWMQAAGFMAVESAANHEMPKVFGTTTKKGAPLGSAVIIGIVSTVVIIAYGLLSSFAGGTASDLFWTLFSFTSLIFLLPFILCFSAFIKLRQVDKDTKRAYRFPGPDWFGIGVNRFCQLVIIFTMMLFFWVPGQPMDWVSGIALGIGFLAGIGLGEIFNINRKRIEAREKEASK
ncbi:MAG TPA: APC family permease [Clostridiales bacterium]|nr:APC family permease [Clostridiales bacterium]